MRNFIIYGTATLLLFVCQIGMSQNVDVNNNGDIKFWNGEQTQLVFGIDNDETTIDGEPTRILRFGASGGANRVMQMSSKSVRNSMNFQSTGILIGQESFIGQSIAESPLHVQVHNANPFGPAAEVLRVEDASTTTAVRNLLTLKNNGGARFALANTATGKRWIISTDSNDTLFWTEANSPDANTAPYFRMFLNGTSSAVLAQMGHLGQSQARFSFLRNGNLNIVGNLNEGSDRNIKEHFATVDSQQILNKVCKLPISTWNYKHDDDSIRHIGPMAQDFRAMFGLGVNDRTIAGIDKDGVAFAAIQGLNKVVADKETRIKSLESEVKSLEDELEVQRRRLDQMEAAMTQMMSQQE